MKSFDLVYSEISQKVDLSEAERQRLLKIEQNKKTAILTAVFGVILLVIALINIVLALLLLGFLFIAFFAIIAYLLIPAPIRKKGNSNNVINNISEEKPKKLSYKEYYQKIIEALVNSYDSNLSYDPHSHIDSESYNLGAFERYDRWWANDLISGDLEGKYFIRMGDFKTEKEHESTDSEGRTQTTYSTIFQGLFCICNLPIATGASIRVRTDKGKLINLSKDSSQVNMDSQEFEKNFDVFSNDKILALRIFTSDIMDLLINMKNEHGNFELTIQNDVICIRMPSSDLFESTTAQTLLEKEFLRKDYTYLDHMCRLCFMISEAVSSKEF